MSDGCWQSSACEHLATALPRQFVESRPYSCCSKALLLLGCSSRRLLKTTSDAVAKYELGSDGSGLVFGTLPPVDSELKADVVALRSSMLLPLQSCMFLLFVPVIDQTYYQEYLIRATS